MSFATQVKKSLLHIISGMASHPEDFSKHPGTDFSRNRMLDFSTLLQLIISMEAGTVKDELLKFFFYDNHTASNSAFFQQRAKLTKDALPFLFHSFNRLYPYTLYKDKYQLLAADGSSFSFTRNPLDTDSYFAPNGKTTNGYNQIHLIPLFDILSKRYTDCLVQPIRKKNEFQALCTLIDRYQKVPGIIPIYIADRGFHSFNVFAHAVEHHSFFMVRATDIKMQRLLGIDLPIQDCFDVQINRILTRSNSKKSVSIRNWRSNTNLFARMSPLTISIWKSGRNIQLPCVFSGSRSQRMAMRISSQICLLRNFRLMKSNTFTISDGASRLHSVN